MAAIAFDFDGVIHKYRQGWQDGSIYDEISKEVIDVMRELQEEGSPILIVSTRDPGQIEEILQHYISCKIVPEDTKFWNDTENVGITDRKLPAVIYIDDRGMKFDPMDVENLKDNIKGYVKGGWS